MPARTLASPWETNAFTNSWVHKKNKKNRPTEKSNKNYGLSAKMTLRKNVYCFLYTFFNDLSRPLLPPITMDNQCSTVHTNSLSYLHISLVLTNAVTRIFAIHDQQVLAARKIYL
jgi:hypothetical protein